MRQVVSLFVQVPLEADLACTNVTSRMGLASSQSKISRAQNRAWLCPDFGVGLTACRASVLVRGWADISQVALVGFAVSWAGAWSWAGSGIHL
jgi:hypothetical protein